jgi:hypothetical protein
MLQTYVNNTGVPLSVAVYLATDHYDHIPNIISTTGLMKSIRQQVLPRRIPRDSPDSQTELLSVVKSRIGTSIHDGIERAWTGGHYKIAMASLGYPQNVIDRVVVNPEGELAPDAIPVYMEIRSFKEIDGVRISGKFDLVAEGRLEDFKSTGTFTWVNNTKEEDYRIQGSIYRWLNPDIITKDHMAIQFFFTDWMPGRAKADPLYPQRITEQLLIPLMSLEETEEYVRSRLQLFAKHKDSKESELPFCTDKELWRRDPEFKYYKNPAKTARSTKNFDNLGDANQRQLADGNVGIVVTIPGQAVACKYCAAFSVCTQKDQLIASGSLIL